MATDPDVGIRRARRDDRKAVVAFTTDTWDRLGGDYVPDAFDRWIDTDGPTQRTLVATIDDQPVGICQGVLLSAHEAWALGMRVAPDARGRDIGRRLTEAVFEWAADRGATVCRNMVFSWNAAGMGQSRALGFEPLTAFRWLEPTPDADASPGLAVETDPALAWSAFRGSDAFCELSGLGLDLEESWALAELTPDRLNVAEMAFAVRDDERSRGMSYRTRTFEREDDGETHRWAEYGVGAWDDVESLRSLAAAISRDAASVGADRARLLISETPRHVSDAAYARIDASEEPDFVFERDLSAYR
ncbi:MAG: N-acetyltransferase family protein [Halobacteriota archaeon]|uniref:GNAT family N-acetyltransferase n=1 Tax=Natronomonas sp. TaxID=2184060 RepID=UPI00397583E7